MMEMSIVINIALTVIGFIIASLLLVVAFFIKKLIAKMEEGNSTLIVLDKKFAVFENQMKNIMGRIDLVETDLRGIKNLNFKHGTIN